jgi:hypothetical protein
MRLKAGYNFIVHRINCNILEELKVNSIEKKLAQYKEKLLSHVNRMENISHPKQLLDY